MKRRKHFYRIEALERRCLLSFVIAPSYDAGFGPWAQAAGDFNRDGTPDLVVANIHSTSLGVLLGNGDGTFQPVVNYDVGSHTYSVVVGDFNGDGAPDVAVPLPVSDKVAVLLGNGDGSFQPIREYNAGPTPEQLTAGDFDGDGDLDLAVTNLGSVITVLRGNGDGSFQAAGSYGVGAGATFLASADVNGDGRQDLVVADGSADTVSVLRGNGDGTFQTRVSYAVGSGPFSVAVGDFNRDGDPDLAVANFGAETVSVLRGNGDGSFQPRVNYAVGPNPRSVAVADFDGDGAPDLAVASDSAGTVRVLRGNGDGTFQAPLRYVAAAHPYFVTAADFNGDGTPDLAVAGYIGVTGGPGTVNVLFGNGNGTFRAPASYAADSHPRAVAAGNFDGDDVPDLAVANYHGATVNILRGRGDGTFQAAGTYAVGPDANALAVGDFNGDGHQDLAKSGSPGGVLLGRGDGTFAPIAYYPVGSEGVATGDVDGDGDLDLVFSIYNENSVSVLLGAGDGTFPIAISSPAGPAPAAVAIGDFDGNGSLDLAVGNYPGTVSVLRGNGDGTFGAPVGYAVPHAFFIVAADLDADGTVDLVAGGVSVLLGLGDGTFQPAIEYDAGGFDRSVAVADFNGDGALDLAAANAISLESYFWTMSVLLGNGDGTFRSRLDYTAGSEPYSVAAGDFNRDGFPDLAAANWEPNTATVLLNDGIWTTKTWAGPASGGDWFSAGNWSPGGAPTAADVVAIADSTVNLPGSATVAGLHLSGAATLTVMPNGGRVLRTSTLSISGGSKLDLSDNAMIIDYTGVTPVATIHALLVRGYDGGAWNGTGINSSAAAASPLHHAALGFAESAALGLTSFAGQAVDSTSLLVRHTVQGDANLDGTTNLRDFNALAANFGATGSTWTRGDFNYDGNTNLADFNLLAGRFGAVLIQAASSSARGASLKWNDDLLRDRERIEDVVRSSKEMHE